MPMKRSGRSVDDASRVIEIDDVLEAMIASGFSDAHRSANILRLMSSFSAADLDHDVATRHGVEFFRRLDERQRVFAGVLSDRFLGDLLRHIAVDGRHAGLDAIARHVVQHHGIARQRADMGNAVAHLPGADHPDTLNIQRHVFVRSMRRPGSWPRFRYLCPLVPLQFYDEPPDDTTGGTANLRHGQRLTLSSSAASSGSA